MFNIGFSELIVIFTLALLLIGPKQLPEIARVFGRLFNEFKRASDDLLGDFVKAKQKVDNAYTTVQSEINKNLKLDESVEKPPTTENKKNEA